MKTLAITMNPDWRADLRASGQRAATDSASGEYQGETLSFETPGRLFLPPDRAQLAAVKRTFG